MASQPTFRQWQEHTCIIMNYPPGDQRRKEKEGGKVSKYGA